MKPRRKYFFFDYDGTLAIPLTRTIPQSTIDTLDKLRSQGHFVALATGRLQCNALDYIQAAGIDNIVADGGYSVTIDGKLVWMESLEVEPVKRFLHRLDDQGIPWGVQTVNELVRYTNNPSFESACGDYYVPTEVIPDLTIDSLTTVYKAYLPCLPGQEQEMAASGLLDGVPWIRYNSNTLFIEPLDKQRGIKMMMEHLGGDIADVVVFGDGLNDISMFLPEWTSIAMGNAKDELKALADYITADCADDGIMKACQHFSWI